MTVRSREIWAVLIVTLVAAAFRFYGFWWGYPYSFHGDESLILVKTVQLHQAWVESGSWNPQVSAYGPLVFYMLWLPWRLGNALIGLLGHPLGIDTVPIMLVGRLISATLGTLTVPVLYWLGRRLWGVKVGLMAAAFLAVAVSPIRESHFYTTDTPLTFWTTLTLALGAGILRYGRRRDYVATGVAMGCLLATKLSAALVVIPLAVAHLIRWGRVERQCWQPRSPRALATGLLWTGSVALGIFFLLNPWPVVDAANYWRDAANYSLITQARVVRGVYRPLYTIHFMNTLPYVYHITNVLFWGLGPVLEGVGLLGLGYALVQALRGSVADVYVLMWVVPYGLIAGAWYVKFVRYMLPLMPFLALLAARWLAAWEDHPSVRRWLARALIGITLLTSTFYALAYMNIYRQPDVRLQALTWLQASIPPGSTLLVERDATLKFNQLATRYGLSQYRIVVLDHYGGVPETDPRFFNPPPRDPEQVRQRLYASLEGVDYIIISNTWMERFLALPEQFPAEHEFYTRLRNGELGFRLIRVFKVYPEFMGIRIVDDAAELSFRIFDHPAIYVFARQE